jgi:hypothetical protein
MISKKLIIALILPLFAAQVAIAENTKFVLHSDDGREIVWSGQTPLKVTLSDGSVLELTRGSVGQGHREVLLTSTQYLPNIMATFVDSSGEKKIVPLLTDTLTRQCAISAGERTDVVCPFSQAPLHYYIERVE